MIGKQILIPMGGGGGSVENFSIGFDLQVVIDPMDMIGYIEDGLIDFDY